MKRILLITHGDLCHGLTSAMNIINGSSDGIDTISLTEKETIEDMMSKVSQKLKEYAEGDIIIILTDIVIGTTTRCVFPLLDQKNIYLVSGVNLPMLLTFYLTDLGSDVYLSIQTMVEESKQTILFVNEQINNQ